MDTHGLEPVSYTHLEDAHAVFHFAYRLRVYNISRAVVARDMQGQIQAGVSKAIKLKFFASNSRLIRSSLLPSTTRFSFEMCIRDSLFTVHYYFLPFQNSRKISKKLKVKK